MIYTDTGKSKGTNVARMRMIIETGVHAVMSSRLPTLPDSSNTSVNGSTMTTTATPAGTDQPLSAADGVSHTGASKSSTDREKRRRRLNKPRKLKDKPVKKACERCCARRQGCDGEKPCERCHKAGLSEQCTYRLDSALPPACARCRGRKERCDRSRPCGRCLVAKLPCSEPGE